MKFLITAVVAYVVYLLLTIGSGTVLLWSTGELIIGAVLAIAVGAVFGNRFVGRNLRMLNPVRWFTFLVYLFPFLLGHGQGQL